MNKSLFFLVFAIFSSWKAATPASLFETGPNFIKNGSHAEITFTLTEYSDVAVEVINENLSIVRHLGAGMLGPNAPEPFIKNSLSQNIIWNYKDDDGNTADSDSDYRVNVKLGMAPCFDRIIGWNGQWLGDIKGVTVDTAGNLYVIMHADRFDILNRLPIYIKVFDRDGNYLRCIAPFPANLPDSKMGGIQKITVDNSREIPFMYNPYNRSMAPKLGIDMHQPVLTSDHKILLPIGNMNKAKGAELYDFEGTRIAAIGTDGGVGSDYIGQRTAWPQAPYNTGSYKYMLYARQYFAISPDERYLYASGVASSYGSPGVGADTANRTDHAVYRVDRNSNNDAQVFMGEKFVPGSDSIHLNNPLGLDVDAQGNIYVCDRGNNRIAVFNSSGVFIKALPVIEPVEVSVHPVTGKIYVYSGEYNMVYVWNDKISHRIIRLSGLDNPAEEIRLEFNLVPYQARGAMELDKYSDPPVIWLAGILDVEGISDRAEECVRNIFKIVDKGDTFENLGNVIAAKNPDPRIGPLHAALFVDPKTEEVWWDDLIFDGNTGQYLRTFIYSDKPYWEQKVKGEIQLHEDSAVIIWAGYDNGKGESKLCRYRRHNGTPLNFDGLGTNTVNLIADSVFGGGGSPITRGFSITQNGDIYLIHHKAYRERFYSYVSIYNRNGIIKDFNLIRMETISGGIRVDKNGNIYMGAHLKPHGRRMPDVFQNFFTTQEHFFIADNDSGAYMLYWDATGSLIKFPATGGSVLYNVAGTDYQSTYSWIHGDYIPQSQRPASYSAQGVEWSKFTYTAQQSKGFGCACEVARHDVDMHSRIFMPDPLTFSVRVYDENGNELSRFGEYGNMDSRGPGGPVPINGIPFNYPLGVAVSDKAAYVNDVVGNRIVRVNLDYAEIGFADIGYFTVNNIPENKINTAVKLDFMNPFKHGNFIKYSAPGHDPAVIKIYSIKGRIVFQFNLPPCGIGAAKLRWDGRDLCGKRVADGTYVLRLESVKDHGRVLTTKKLIIF
ncbi:MAG: hypothetical protein ABIA63_09400 [bacterium]